MRNAQTAPKSVSAAPTGIMTKLVHRYDVCNGEYSTLGPMHPAPPVHEGPTHPETPGAQVSGRLISISKPPITTARPRSITEKPIRIVLFRAHPRDQRRFQTRVSTKALSEPDIRTSKRVFIKRVIFRILHHTRETGRDA